MASRPVKGALLQVQVTGLDEARQLLREQPERLQAAAEILTIQAARTLLEQMRQVAPAPLPDFLKQARRALTMVDARWGLAACEVRLEGVQVSELAAEEISTTTLQFHARKTELSPASKFLIANGPWPADMVPVKPVAAEVRAEATQGDVAQIDWLRNQLRQDWDRLRLKAGQVGVKLAKEPVDLKRQRVERDVVHRLLLHVQSEPAIWAAALAATEAQYPALFAEVERVLADPRYNFRRALLRARARQR